MCIRYDYYHDFLLDTWGVIGTAGLYLTHCTVHRPHNGFLFKLLNTNMALKRNEMGPRFDF